MDIPFLATMLWWLFLASWWLSALWVAKATTKAPIGQRIAYFAGFTVGFGLLFVTNQTPHDTRAHLWSAPAALEWALVAGQLVCFGFAWWARLHLGRLWSGMLTLREGHRIVDTGPYALARHPIYTGFIGAGWCYALIEARPLPLAGAAVLSAVMAIKARTEEAFLRRELGADDYDAYRARTRMLLPFPR